MTPMHTRNIPPCCYVTERVLFFGKFGIIGRHGRGSAAGGYRCGPEQCRPASIVPVPIDTLPDPRGRPDDRKNVDTDILKTGLMMAEGQQTGLVGRKSVPKADSASAGANLPSAERRRSWSDGQSRVFVAPAKDDPRIATVYAAEVGPAATKASAMILVWLRRTKAPRFIPKRGAGGVVRINGGGRWNPITPDKILFAIGAVRASGGQTLASSWLLVPKPEKMRRLSLKSKPLREGRYEYQG